ncbi:MAG: methionine--tRNA ligase, partial [Bdellovibrionales bacterium]|nr:methionine--tRNA ligase [Bdellovibrionales bacterium]
MGKHIGVFVAWPYANGDLHLGHIAGAYLPADIFARYHRLRGNSVMMVSGSDAHGTPITLKAKEEGATPLEIVERYHARFLEGWQRLGISFDLFTHTHTRNHINLTQSLFTKLRDQGDLTVGTQEQFYDEAEGIFLPDRYVRGTCPFCGYDRARGDQCENCGKTFEARELVDPVSKLSETTPVLRETQHYFFQMAHYQEPLLEYINRQPHWRLNVQNFTRSMVEEGLKERAITRDIDWGVPVPEAGWEQKVIYVWFDAVIGYLSASLEWSARGADPEAWRKWWEQPDSKGYYFIGKDNIPFHTVIWPIELMAYDSKLNLPYDVPANQFLNIDGEKFSTSRGLAVWLLQVLDVFDPDAVRFYLASILPETKDANFSWDELITRNNGELVAAWGNLVNRVLGFAYKRYGGKVPQPQALDSLDQSLLERVDAAFPEIARAYEEVRLRDALKEALTLTREVNKYLDVKAPWTAFKTDPEQAGTAVYVAMRAIDSLKLLLAPVLPHTAQKVHEFFGYTQPLFGELTVDHVEEEGGSR